MIAVERGAHRDQFVDPRRPLVDEDAYSVGVTEAGAGRERVRQVEIGGVLIAAENRGDTPLCPPRGGLIEIGLRENTDAQTHLVGRAHRGGQTRHPAAHHQQIEHVDATAHVNTIPRLSMSRVVPMRAATSKRTDPESGAIRVSVCASTTVA